MHGSESKGKVRHPAIGENGVIQDTPAKTQLRLFIMQPRRSDGLNTQELMSVDEAQNQLQAWQKDYNASRCHRALRERTPGEFTKRFAEHDTIADVKLARQLILSRA